MWKIDNKEDWPAVRSKIFAEKFKVMSCKTQFDFIQKELSKLDNIIHIYIYSNKIFSHNYDFLTKEKIDRVNRILNRLYQKIIEAKLEN